MSIQSQMREIAATYYSNPFHNWPHGLGVWNAMMKLEKSRWVVSPGRMAGYFHDSDHRWFVQEDDEERATQIAHDKLIEWWYTRDYIASVRTHIMGTIFNERAHLILPEQKLIADADLSKLWGGYIRFVQNSVRYLLETEKKWDISDDRIREFFKKDQPGFFQHLRNISGKSETPFLTPQAQKMYPNFARNTDTLAQDAEENPAKLIEEVRKLEARPDIVAYRKTA